MVKRTSRKRHMMLCLWIAALLLSILPAAEVRCEQQGYGMTRYHEVHLRAGLHCEYCHVDPYKQSSWVRVDSKGVHLATGPTNTKRSMDKQKCLECHRWGQKAWYSGEPAAAGTLYKK